MAINYDPDLENLLSSTVSSFNAKVKKLQLAHVHHLPSIQNIKEIKSSYSNRSDLMYYINQLQRFNNKDAERLITNQSGVTLTQWEWDKLEQDRIRALKILAQEQKREASRNMYYSFDRLTTMKSEQNFLSAQSMRGSHKNRLTRDELKTLRTTQLKYLNRKERELRFKNSFIKIIEQAFGSAGYTSEQINEIIKDFNNLSAQDLADASKNNRFVVSLLENYAVFVTALDKADKDMIESAIKNITYNYNEYQQHKDAINNSIKQGNVETW